MRPIEQVCDPKRIDAYLEEQLTDPERTEFETHLEQCEACRDKMQERAAAPELWNDAEKLLPNAMIGRTSLFRREAKEDLEGRKTPIASVLDSLTPTDDPEMLGRIGDYEVSGIVGVGGMGAVLKAFDKSLRRVVAIKVMAPHLADSGSARTRFQREARAAAAITHDNVIDIYGVSETNGLPYLVMPFARGPSLQKRIDESGPLTTIQVIRIGRQIAAGLSAAHEQGLVHRDIKPANILLDEGIERVFITDFGVARAMDDASMTQTGLIAGTPQFMSPEQARGDTVDQRSDLFSLGSILYNACTGRPPFRAEAAYGILRRITDTSPRPVREINPDIPDWLCGVIDRLMAKHPADRYQTAEEVAGLLETCLAHLQQPEQVALPNCLPRLPEARANEQSAKPKLDDKLTRVSGRFSGGTKTWIVSLAVLFLFGFGCVAWLMGGSPDIEGKWSSRDWGTVELNQDEQESGTYLGSIERESGEKGTLQLKWDPIQRRFNGEWKLGEQQSGAISVRATRNGGLRGAIALDPDVEAEAESPRLRDFAWRPFEDEATGGRVAKQGTRSNRTNRVSQLGSDVQGTISSTAPAAVTNSGGMNLTPFGNSIESMFGASSDLDERLRSLQSKINELSKSNQTLQDRLAAQDTKLIALQSQLEQSIESGERARIEPIQQAISSSKRHRDLLATELEQQNVQLDNARAALSSAQREQQTILDLLRVQVEVARQALRLAESKNASIQDQFAAGLVPQNKAAEVKQQLASCVGQLRQLEVVLNFYQGLGQTNVETAQPGKARPNQDASNVEATVENVTSSDSNLTRLNLDQDRATSRTDSANPFARSLQGETNTETYLAQAADLGERFGEARSQYRQLQIELERQVSILSSLDKDLDSYENRIKEAEQTGDAELSAQQLANLTTNMKVLQDKIQSQRAIVLSKEKSLQDTQQSLERFEQEKMLMLEILHNRIDATKRRLESEQTLMDHSRKLFEKGYINQTELIQAEGKIATIEADVRVLDLMRDYIAKIGKE